MDNKKNIDINHKKEIVFSLENRFPDTSNIFKDYFDVDVLNDETLIFLDTNVLLLPYVAKQLGQQDIKEIENLYVELKNNNRLFISDRVAREFIKNRDSKICEIVQSLYDDNSKIKKLDTLSKIFQDTTHFLELKDLAEDINKKIEDYKKKHNKMVNEVKDWKGKDPITKIYNKIFKSDNIIFISDSRDDLIKEWEYRERMKIPPGYKDASKDDSGIGDFLIWKSMMQLSKEKKKNIVFITGEKKSDWFNLSNNNNISIRFELLDEFHRYTKQYIDIINLTTLLSRYQISSDVINKIENAEYKEESISKSIMYKFKQFITEHEAKKLRKFDYSTNNGLVEITNGEISFNVKFSKASDSSIHVYNDGGPYKIARVKNSTTGDYLDFNNYDSSSRTYTINRGELILFKDNQENILAIKITDIQDDTRGDNQDCVWYLCRIFEKGETVISL